MRTFTHLYSNKGPIKLWQAHIGKVVGPLCDKCEEVEDRIYFINCNLPKTKKVNRRDRDRRREGRREKRKRTGEESSSRA